MKPHRASDDFDRLAAKYFEAELSDKEAERLNRLIETDEKCAKRFLQLANVHGGLHELGKSQELAPGAVQGTDEEEKAGTHEVPDIHFGTGIHGVAERRRKSERKRKRSSRRRMLELRTERHRRRRSINPWVSLLLAACVLLIPTVYFGGFLVQEQPIRLGKVVVVTEMAESEKNATVVLRTAGDSRQKILLKGGTILHAGDRIRTAKTAQSGGSGPRPVMLAFEFDSGVIVSFADDTEAVLAKPSADQDLDLIHGQLYANASSLNGGSGFGVHTDLGSVETRNGNFDLFASADISRLRVEAKGATFKPSSGRQKSLDVSELEEIVARRDGRLEGPIPVDLAAIWRGWRGTGTPTLTDPPQTGGEVLAAVVQIQLPDDSFSQRNVDHALALLDRTASKGVRLILFPACTVYGLSGKEWGQTAHTRNGPLWRAIAGRARRHSVYIALGLYLREKSGDVYNTAILFGPSGSVILEQRKNVLSGNEGRRKVSAGKGYAVQSTALGRIGMVISKDVYAGGLWRETFTKERPDLLLVLNSDASISRYEEILRPFSKTIGAPILIANQISGDATGGASGAHFPDGRIVRNNPGESIELVRVPVKKKAR